MRTFKKFTEADYFIAKRLREFRLSIGMSQKELGELTGLSFQQIQKYEKVENRITAAKLYEFAQILQRPIASFYEGLECEAEGYNYVPSAELTRKKVEDEMNKDLLPLIRSFNRIENKQIKKRIVELVQDISGPFYKKIKKHEYS